MANWVTYWSGPTANDAEGEDVNHVASNQFGNAGVECDDSMYVISYVHGQLHVVTSLVVDHVVPGSQAEQILKRKNLWKAQWHVIARADSVQVATMAATLTRRQMAEMTFIKDGNEVPPARNRHGAIDPQTFRSTRQIDEATAAMLQAVLASSR